MIEESISLNVFREPLQKRREKPDVRPSVSKPTPKIGEKRKASSKMTVWKALKIKEPKTGDLTSKPDSLEKPIKLESGKTAGKWKTTRLFANNPEVPKVLQRTVNPIKEPIFSSKSFKDFNLHPFMVKTLDETLELSQVTAVQERLIPVALEGRDVLVRSQTGSGKTLAFAVPIIQFLQAVRPKISRSDGVKALVIAPSRELVLQIHEIFTKLTKSFTWLVPGILMGGERRKAEKARIRKGITILTCTPGRLLDHMDKTDCLHLDGVKYFVLDEADRMLDLGYEEDVARIVEKLKATTNVRQTFLLSATLTPAVGRLAGLSLNDPVHVDVIDAVPASVPVHAQDTVQEALILPGGLSHSYIVTPAKLRLVTLTAFIMDKCLVQGNKIIVFMATQDMVDFHSTLLTTAIELYSGGQELELKKLHGNMVQTERTKVFLEFRKAQSAVLLCTDVAARGLDLPEVDWVVQYNGPASVSDYVHRVGRTARRGLPGSAVIFLATTETEFITLLGTARVKITQIRMEDVLNKLCVINRDLKNMQEAATRLQTMMEGVVDEEREVHDLACKAYTSWVRFYASYPKSLKECFSVKSVHLGHFAKSFALKEPPTVVSKHAKTVADKKITRQRPRDASRAGREKAQKSMTKFGSRRSQISEFDSGLEPIKKKKRKT